MGLSTHVLDTHRGWPAVGVQIVLRQLRADVWTEVGRGVTDGDGRCRTLLGERALEATMYELKFETSPYFAAKQVASLYPYVKIVFTVTDAAQHYHIPLLLTANGYTTYRGS